jgi:hypothetical protein
VFESIREARTANYIEQADEKLCRLLGMSASRLEWGAPFDHTEALSRVGKLLGQDDQEEELDRLYDESKPVEEENDPPAGETSEPKEVEEPAEPAEETSEAMEVEGQVEPVEEPSEAMEVEGQVEPVEEPSEAMEAEEQVEPVEETSQVVGVEEEVEAHAEPEGERTVPRLFEGGW